MIDGYVLPALLGLPLAAGGCLARVRRQHDARALNVGFSFLTCAAALALATGTGAQTPEAQ